MSEAIDLARLDGPAQMLIVIVRADGSRVELPAVTLAAGDTVEATFEEITG